MALSRISWTWDCGPGNSDPAPDARRDEARQWRVPEPVPRQPGGRPRVPRRQDEVGPVEVTPSGELQARRRGGQPRQGVCARERGGEVRRG